MLVNMTKENGNRKKKKVNLVGL